MLETDLDFLRCSLLHRRRFIIMHEAGLVMPLQCISNVPRSAIDKRFVVLSISPEFPHEKIVDVNYSFAVVIDSAYNRTPCFPYRRELIVVWLLTSNARILSLLVREKHFASVFHECAISQRDRESLVSTLSRPR